MLLVQRQVGSHPLRGIRVPRLHRDRHRQAADPSIKRSLVESTEQAVSRGVFGVPTMLIGDELFWGLDQLPYLELYLEGLDPLQRADWDQSNFRGPSAWRTGISRHDAKSD